MAELRLPDPRKDIDAATGLPLPRKEAAPVAPISDYAKALASNVAQTFVTVPGQAFKLMGGTGETLAAGQRISQDIADTISPAGQQVMANKLVEDDGSIGPTPIQSILMGAASSAPSVAQSLVLSAPISRALQGANVAGRVAGGLERAGLPAGASRLTGRLAEAAPFGVMEGMQAGLQNSADIGQRIRDPQQSPTETMGQVPEFQKALIDSITANPEMPAEEHIARARETVARAAELDVLAKTGVSTGGIGVLTGGGALPRMAGLARQGQDGILRSIVKGAKEEALQEIPQSGMEQLLQNAAIQQYADPNQALGEGVANQALLGGAAGALLGGAGSGVGAIVNRRRTPQEILVDPSAGPITKSVAAGQLSGAIATGVDGTPLDTAQPPEGEKPGETPTEQTDIEKARQEDEANPPRNWTQAGLNPDDYLTPEDRDAAYDEAFFQLSEELAPQGLEPTEEEIAERQVQILTALLQERAAAAPGAPTTPGETDGQGQEAAETATPGLLTQPPAGDTPAGPIIGGPTSPGGPTVDDAAHGAATSPKNDLPEPTEAQKEAGNYPKGHLKVNGLDVSIENPSGSTRSGTDPDGKAWSTTMVDHYGYIRRTEAADSTEAKRQGVDAFVKAGTPENYTGPVYVVDQINPKTGEFDEHKAMIGYTSRADALRGYKRHYAEDWQGYNAIRRMEADAFKDWVVNGDTKAPIAPQVPDAPDVPTGATPGEISGEPGLTPPAGAGGETATGMPTGGGTISGEVGGGTGETTAPPSGEEVAPPHVPLADREQDHSTIADPIRLTLGNKSQPQGVPLARIEYDESGYGDFVASISYNHNHGGHGGPLARNSKYRGATEQEAIAKAAQGIYDSMQRERASQFWAGYPDTVKNQIALIEAWALKHGAVARGEDAGTGPGTPPDDVGQAPGPEVLEPADDGAGAETDAEPPGGSGADSVSPPDAGGGTVEPDDEGAERPPPAGGDGGGTGAGTVTGGPSEPPKEPKPPRPEVTVDTPVGLGQAKAHWAKNVPDEDKAGFATPTFKTLGGVPHIIGEGGVYHFVRRADDPKALEAKEGYVNEQARIQHEGVKVEPIDVMVAQGDAFGLATEVYREIREPQPEDLPVVLIDDRLVRFPVKLDERDLVEAKLKKLKFRITDRSQETSEAERIMVSAIYRPETGAITDVGEQMGGGRKDQNPPPVAPKGADEKALDKFLADLHKSNFLDKDANAEQSFGAMMFKEGLFDGVKHALDFIAGTLRKLHFDFRYEKSDRRVLLEALASDRWAEKVNDLATRYTERLKRLQEVVTPHARVEHVVEALRKEYVEDAILNANGEVLKTVLDINLQTYLAKYGQIFAQNQDETDQTHRIVKKDPDVPPRLERIVRVGMKDHRGGKNVDAETEFKEAFGFRGVEFGNWVNQVERQENLNLAYDSLLDMADLTGLDPKMIGLDDDLGLAIGARGRGNAAAHFEPSNNVINLTKTQGNGTVGHEWAHALDHNLPGVQDNDDDKAAARKLVDDIKQALRYQLEPEKVDSAMRAILRQADEVTNRNVPPKKALFEAVKARNATSTAPQVYSHLTRITGFYDNARQMDRGATQNYWSTPVEMFARGWESFLYDKAKGGTPYLVSPTRADGAMTPQNGYKGTPYPRGKERQYVSEVYQFMLDQIEGDTLKVKKYTVETTVEHVPDLGWTVVDQYGINPVHHNGFLFFYSSEEGARVAAEKHNGTTAYLTLERKQYGKANQIILPFLKNVDKIMEEMGIRLYPELKDGSMAESMFFSLRQGWWPENNHALKVFAAQAHGIDVSKVDLVITKNAQEDFEAALARFSAQIITDMRAQGADEKAIYDRMVEMYNKQPNLDVRTTASWANQAYSTPLPIAFVSGQLGRVTTTSKVLDPTAGSGLLTVTVNPKNALMIEKDEHRARNLRLMQYGKVIEGDALQAVENDIKKQEADVLLMNPPFGETKLNGDVVSWDGTVYTMAKIDHLIAARAMRAMADNGRATILLGAHRKPGAITTTDTYFLNWLYTNYNVVDHFEIDGKLYARQGAEWPLRVLVVAGRKETEGAYPKSTVVDRVYDFDSLWRRYVQAYDRSRQVLVGAGVKSGDAGGADSVGGGVRPGDTGQAGGSDRGSGGRGRGSGAGTPGSGRGATGSPGPAGGGTAADDGHRGDGPDGRPGDVGAGQPEGGAGGDQGAVGPDADGLSGIDDDAIDDIFDDVFGGKKEGAGRGTRGGSTRGGGTRGGAKGATPGRGKSDLDSIPGMSDLLGELEQALKPEADPDAPPALSRKAGGEFNTHQYARLSPVFEKMWARLTEAIQDFAERVRAFATGVLQAFGNVIRPYARYFVAEVKDRQEATPSSKKPVIATTGGPNQTPYKGRSKGDQSGIFIPDSQAAFTEKAFDALEVEYGDIDEFVRSELGYDSVEQMFKHLSGYQVDAIGLALAQMKTGNGFIVGDDTGVGKGRVAASIISWAKRNDKIPIFFSFKKDLYTDMYRDLTHIGRKDTRIMVTDGDAKVYDLKNNVVLRNTDEKAKEQLSHIINTGELPKNIDALFTTYYQINTKDHKGVENARRRALKRLVASGKAVLIMDEAHNAAGESNTGEFFQSLLTGFDLFGRDVDGNPIEPPVDWEPPAAVYLSATFAKRPSNMPLYVRTHLRHAANNPQELVAMFASGGDPLQRIASEMLTEAGSMIRRERSYQGVKFDTVIDEDNAAIDARAVDQVTEVLRQVVHADRAFADWAEGDGRPIIDSLLPPGWNQTFAGSNANVSMNKSLFTSIVHNYVGQLLLATKVKKGVELAVKALNEGRKPLFALQNTMEAALGDYAGTAGVKIGDEMPDFGWQSILQRGLTSAHRVTFKRGTGKNAPSIRVNVPLHLLPDEIMQEFQAAQDLIDSFQSSLPGSPIDALRAEMSKYRVWRDDKGAWHAGMTAPEGVTSRPLQIVEVTGRKVAVDYSGQVPKFVKRSDPENQAIIRGFQDGGVDALILNSSGSTGISLHASEGAKDQRPREMIVLQANPDIAVFKQTLGRTNRTGQVEWPIFKVLGTAIPAERRLLAVLKKKIGTLFSNTSAGEGTTSIDAVDFINMYGDVIVAQYLQDNADIAAFIGVQIPNNPVEAMGSDISLTASGRAALLTVDEQQSFFDTIEQNFLEEIATRNATGTNALDRRVIDTQASLLGATVLEEGMDESNPFTRTATLARYEIDVHGDIPTPEKVRHAIETNLAGRSTYEVVESLANSLKTRYDAALDIEINKRAAIEKALSDPKITPGRANAENERLTKINEKIDKFGSVRETTISRLQRDFPIGRGFNDFTVGDVDSQAVVIGYSVSRARSGGGNPFTPSEISIVFQRNVPDGRISVPLSKLGSDSGVKAAGEWYGDAPIDDWFSPRYVSGGRKERYFGIGNILRARAILQNAGEILVYTKRGHTPDNPILDNGIMLAAKWTPQNINQAEFAIRYPGAAVDYLASVIQHQYLDAGDAESAEKFAALVKYPVDFPDGLHDEVQHNGQVLKAAGGKWLMSMNRYSPFGVRLSVSRRNGADLIKSKLLAAALGEPLAIKRGQDWTQSVNITDPEKIRRVLEVLAKSSTMLTHEKASDYVREISKKHFAAEAGSPAASRGAATGGLSRAAVEAIVAKLTSRWANAPRVVVVDSLQDPQVPDRLRIEDARQRSQGAQGAPEGFYDAGTVYMVAPQLAGERDVRRVLFHEALGHFGLRGLYGKQLAQILDQIAAVRRVDVERVAARYGLDMDNATDRSIAAEEVLANLAQTNPQIGFVRRAVLAIRNWLRSVGINMRVSDDEIIANFIIPARNFVTKGRQAQSGELRPALSRQDAERAAKATAQAIQNLRSGGFRKAWQQVRDFAADHRDLGLPLIGRRQIAEVYGKLIPALHDYSNEMQRYDAAKNAVAADADDLVKRWRKLPDRIRLADTMHGATLAGYDPDTSKTPVALLTPEMRAVYDDFHALSDDAKAVYRQARDMYAHHWLQVKTSLARRIERAEIDGKRKKAMLWKLEDDFTKQLSGVYFPLARFGDYIVTARDEEGRILATIRAESIAEARAERERLQQEYPDADVSKVIKAKEYNAARDSVSREFVQQLYGVIEASELDGEAADQIKDSINQLYLTSLPDVSWAKHGIHRKGTPGFDKDARRAFANNMFHGSYHLAKLNHSDVLADYLRDMQEYVDSKREDEDYDSVAAQQVIDEMMRRHDLTMNPPYNPLTETLTAAGFIWMLGASPASAAVNLSQTALVAYPMLGAEFGFGRASAALLQASKQTAESRNDLRKVLSGAELEAFAKAVRDGIIDITQAHDLAAIAEGRDTQLHGSFAPFMRASSYLFHHAERFNRQATFLAAFRMAREKGQDEEAAFDTARRLTYASHFDYAQSNRPRLMMGSWSKVWFLFKQYGQNMAYTLVHNAIEAAKGDRTALKTLSGLLVATALSAGVLGLPMVSVILGLASLLGSDDDEPWDAEAALRNMLADALGKGAGEMLAHGVFRGTPFAGDLAARVGLDALFIKDIDLTLDPNKVWQELVYAGLGPVLSIGVNMFRGAGDMLKGDYVRGTEAMLPKALGDTIKAFRYATEGAVDRTGVEIIKDVSAGEVAAQFLGFTPARLKEGYEGRGAVLGLERALTERRNELLTRFSKAVIAKDNEARIEALQEIQAFNAKQPMHGITQKSLLQSVQNRMRRAAEAKNGIVLPRRSRGLLEEGRFANVE